MSKAQVLEKTRPTAAVDTIEAPTCQHHWRIESPRGAMSMGVCKRCGEEREFRNSATDHLWEDESGSGYNAWRGVRPAKTSSSDEDEVAASPRSRNERALIA
jgi:hypothetical protein